MADIDLRLGDWRSALAHVGEVDALVTDPPYCARTHAKHNARADRGSSYDGADRQRLSYAHWTPEDVAEFVTHWAPRCRGWMCAMTSADLALVYRDAYEAAGLCSFAPVGVYQHRPRLSGDGPGSCLVYLMVARPRTAKFARWGSLPGLYQSACDHTGIVAGGKPIELMRAIVRDYSRPGDLVCDPCAGGGSTLIAAATEGRRALGAELNAATYGLAQARIGRGYTPVFGAFAE